MTRIESRIRKVIVDQGMYTFYRYNIQKGYEYAYGKEVDIEEVQRVIDLMIAENLVKVYGEHRPSETLYIYKGG